MDVDVTERVEHRWNDRDLLPLVKCVCGQKFGEWEFFIGLKDWTIPVRKCPNCKKELYFTNEIRVWIKE